MVKNQIKLEFHTVLYSNLFLGFYFKVSKLIDCDVSIWSYTFAHVSIGRFKVKINIDLECNLICCKKVDDKLWPSSELPAVINVTATATYRC